MRDYMRRRRGGGEVRAKRPSGSGHITQGGYMVVQAVGHPVAAHKGRTFLHRKVLYDAIGPGEHPCHWCARAVSWENPWPHADALVVDHLDGDKLHNERENLAPSCRACNTSVTIARGQLLALQRELDELRATIAAA